MTFSALNFSCVPDDKCGGFLDVKGAEDGFVCEDDSLVCCHKDQIEAGIESSTDTYCSDLAEEEGYR